MLSDELDQEKVFIAHTARASRAARSPPPSEAAVASAWKVANEVAAELEKRGLERLQRLPPIEWARPQPGRRCYHESRVRIGAGALVAQIALDSSAPARPTAQLSHVFSLQRPIDANSREASHLSYQSVLPLEAAQLAAAGMRSNSVRSSVVHKLKKTCGGGQQTTRNNLGDMAASWAAQAVSVAVSIAVAKYICRARHGHVVSDPGATMAIDCSTLVSESPLRPAGFSL